jgi:hypothetical protein
LLLPSVPAAERYIAQHLPGKLQAEMRPKASGGCQMKRTLKLGMGAVLSLALAAPVADACSRAVYFGEEGQTVTGRTMDWAVSDVDTNMWLYPRGLERNSNTATPLSGPRNTAASPPRSTKARSRTG